MWPTTAPAADPTGTLTLTLNLYRDGVRLPPTGADSPGRALTGSRRGRGDVWFPDHTFHNCFRLPTLAEPGTPSATAPSTTRPPDTAEAAVPDARPTPGSPSELGHLPRHSLAHGHAPHDPA